MDAAPLLLQTLGLMLIGATTLVVLMKPLNLPSIVVCIFAGLALGPIFGLISIHGGHGAAGEDAVAGTIDAIAHLGIVLLLFMVGLELSLERVRQVGTVAFVAGGGQVLATCAIGFAACLPLGFSPTESIIIALCLTFSSTVVVIRLLEQRGELATVHGRIAVGVLLVEDMLVIVGLTLLHGLGDAEAGVGATIGRLALAFASMGLLLAASMLAAKFLLARPFAWAARRPETLVVWGLGWCLCFVGLAKWLGLSPEIGAFLAGVSLAQLHCAHDLARRLHPLMAFFIAIFFVALGAGTDLRPEISLWLAAGVLSLIALTLKPFIIVWLVARCGYGIRTSFFSGVSLAQISEFSFIFASVAMAAGLLREQAVAVVTLVGIVTIVASAMLFPRRESILESLRRRGWTRVFAAADEPAPAPPEPRRGHIVVGGMNSMGRRLVQVLAERGEQVVAIDTDPRKLAGLPAEHLHGTIDDLAVLDAANLATAKLGISALRIEEPNQLFAHRCRELAVPCVIHAFDDSLIEDLRLLGCEHLVESKTAGSVRLVTALAETGVVAP